MQNEMEEKLSEAKKNMEVTDKKLSEAKGDMEVMKKKLSEANIDMEEKIDERVKTKILTYLDSLGISIGTNKKLISNEQVSDNSLEDRQQSLSPYSVVHAKKSWVVYKESNWITAILWAVLLVCLGSITTCGYIVLQFLKLSTQESLQDPIYFVLLRHQKKTETEQQRKCSLLTARILSLALGCLMLGTLIYTIVTDGSPFRKDVFTPWLSATVIDLYVNIVVLSVWVAYKESSWLSAAFWIILIICFGSISTCAYIFLQLFSLSSQDPVYLGFFSSRKRQICAPSV